MEMIATDDKPKPLPAYGAHPHHHPPPVQRIHPPAETPHGLPPSHGPYEQAWRTPYPSPYDNGNPDRRHSTPAQPPVHSHSYPAPPPSRELPQLPEGPYARPNSLPAPPTHSPTDGHPQHPPPYRPMNGGPPNEPVPQSTPPDYRPRMAYPPHEGPPHSGEPPAAGQYIPHLPAGPYDPAYYHSQIFGARQRRAARAQQVSRLSLVINFHNLTRCLGL
jgi:hypothetical protein